MKHFLKPLAVVLLWLTAWLPGAMAATDNPQAVTDLLTRVTNAADKFETVLDESLSATGEEVFVISSKNGKPCIKGSSLSALTTGIGWYLNHYAHVNIAWNQLTTDLSAATLPLPAADETHTASVDYRYYLNYCTFSYSMSVWTWDRWQKEIDWMALHGINMPLQIVGLDVVWKKLLTEDLGYTSDEANAFIAGPCFQAWWGMNNLEGWGGPNPDWWYTRQEKLAKDILARERELGMEPVLPGYAGMVPSDIGKKGYTGINQGNWCGFVRPYILDPNTEAFAVIAAKYYARLAEVMGTSTYYSMDPFHEGANTSGIDVPSAYAKIAAAMTTANADGKWVIQFWQWSPAQYNVLSQVTKGKLIVLDLFSDAHTHFGDYKGHDAVYCMLANFGGRTGLFGRLEKVMTDFYKQKTNHSNIKGIGATPEAIEQVPVLYDALFELPWRETAPNVTDWVNEYATSRYGTASAQAAEAWQLIKGSALKCETGLQGPHEAVLCARPALSVGSVSTWGGTGIFYNASDIARAAHLLLEAGLSGKNYSYDLTDVTRQALTDYAYYLLPAIKSAKESGNTALYESLRDKYLQLILDLDNLLCTNENFMLGRWTQMARGIADEVTGTTDSDRDWLELNNARTLITTWGPQTSSESGGLRDYSYREWGGMLKDFYYARWKKFFKNGASSSGISWFTNDWDWAHDGSLSYDNTPTGSTAEIAAQLLAAYFVKLTPSGAEPTYYYRGMAQTVDQDYAPMVYAGKNYTAADFNLSAGLTPTVCIDLNGDGNYTADETFSSLPVAIPSSAAKLKVKAQIDLGDGTVLNYHIAIADEITTPRTVSVGSANAEYGTAAIEGTSETSVTNTEFVTIVATPATGYDFLNWTDADGNIVGTDNPYTYYGKDEASFTANFIVNKWGSPTEILSELGTVNNYEQYVSKLTAAGRDREPVEIYTNSNSLTSLFHTTSIVNAAAGSHLSLAWQDTEGKNGLSYCRLSAYIDLNADGDFEDEGELLAVVGDKKSDGNSMLSDGSLDILLPYDMPTGITHIRLRFDGSYEIDRIDATTNARPAKDQTTRPVYDIPLNVTEYADYACTVTVMAGNIQGTVDANGQPDTYTYSVGEDVVLRAYPADGYEVKWTDQYGRELPSAWVDGNFLRFKAVENATYTANFIQKLTVGNWILNTKNLSDNRKVVTEVVSGSGELDLSDTSVTLINDDAFAGNTDLTSLTLPRVYGLLLDYSQNGAGTADFAITPDVPLPGNKAWALHIEATGDGSSYNKWGSALLATGTSALANDYTDGFQFYYAKDGSLTCKIDGNEELKFSTVGSLGSPFSIDMTYDGAGGVKVTATSSTGVSETRNFTGKVLADQSVLSNAIPTGVNITKLQVTYGTPLQAAAFAGCTSLTDIYVQEGIVGYESHDGVLFSADNNLLVYPEGRLAKRPFRLASTEDTPRYIYATPQFDATGSNMQSAGRGLPTASLATAGQASSLFTLVPIEGGYKVKHLNSARFWGSKPPVEMPIDPTRWHGVYNYTMSVADNKVNISLVCDGKYATAGDAVTLSSTASAWTLEEVNEIEVSVGEALWTALCLPVAVAVPDEATCTMYKATNATTGLLTLTALTPGTVIPAGEGVLLEAPAAGTVSLAVHSDDEATSLADNILSGATAQRSGLNTKTFYGLGNMSQGVGFYLSSGTIVPANKAYLLASALSGQPTERLAFGGDATSIGQTTLNANQERRLYDLNGRRVSQPERGIYVDDKGQKYFIP
ncbi:MAG: alpha-N-acetylglucosaminidase TIM-barrel domain-containing protein [Alloprevotella sp.]|nr:alpha-N-acetylglucosaminidase TIM-barrel domain-containing protein [Alloprevotella sp.]